jgi:hypothetical protein
VSIQDQLDSLIGKLSSMAADWADSAASSGTDSAGSAANGDSGSTGSGSAAATDVSESSVPVAKPFTPPVVLPFRPAAALSPSSGARGDAIDMVLSLAARQTAVTSLHDAPEVAAFRDELVDGMIRADTANQLLRLVNEVITRLM